MRKTIKIHLLEALVALGHFAWEAQRVLPWKRINPFKLWNSWLAHRANELTWLMFEPNGEYALGAKLVSNDRPIEDIEVLGSVAVGHLHNSARRCFPPGTHYKIYGLYQEDHTQIVSYYGDKAQEHEWGKVIWSGATPTEHKNRFWRGS